jgi:hypothetical protein
LVLLLLFSFLYFVFLFPNNNAVFPIRMQILEAETPPLWEKVLTELEQVTGALTHRGSPPAKRRRTGAELYDNRHQFVCFLSFLLFSSSSFFLLFSSPSSSDSTFRDLFVYFFFFFCFSLQRERVND